jgi:hypothetical protein
MRSCKKYHMHWEAVIQSISLVVWPPSVQSLLLMDWKLSGYSALQAIRYTSM